MSSILNPYYTCIGRKPWKQFLVPVECLFGKVTPSPFEVDFTLGCWPANAGIPILWSRHHFVCNLASNGLMMTGKTSLQAIYDALKVDGHGNR